MKKYLLVVLVVIIVAFVSIIYVFWKNEKQNSDTFADILNKCLDK